MVLRGRSARFNFLTSGLDTAQWRLLGAIAAERELGRSVLLKLAHTGQLSAGAANNRDAEAKGVAHALDQWLAQALSSGLLSVVPPGFAVGLVSAPALEPGFAVHPDYEQLVLRELAKTNRLRDIARETESLLAARSVADLSLALQQGDLGQFLHRYAVQRLPRKTTPRSAEEWLRVTLCNPFDPAWLTTVWKDEGLPVAVRVLRESLDGPAQCDELYAWLSKQVSTVDREERQLSLESTLCQHAILRDKGELVDELAGSLPEQTALGYRAAARFLDGDLIAAQALLSEVFGGALRVTAGLRGNAKRGDTPQWGAVAPILALLLCARDTTEATTVAKRVLALPTNDAQRGTARAFRTLLQYLEQPKAQQRRIDYHQLEPGAGAWEILLSALTVHLHMDQSSLRATWAQQLVRKAAQWKEGGYAWISRHSLILAYELNPEYCEKELALQHLDASALEARPRELKLWDLVAPKPEWKKTLQALAEVSEKVTGAGELSHRVAWFVDMSNGSLSRPALQHYRASAQGWSQVKRLSLTDLYEHRENLPPEDLRVLACTREASDGQREFTPEAYEMLIDHPRVFNGVRGANVEVVRGSCRVETEEESGFIRVVVEPEGAELGVNVVPQSETRLVIYRVTQAMRRVIEVLPHGVRIPKAHEAEVLTILGKLAESVEVRSPQLGAERTVEADSTPCLRLSPQAGAWLVQAGVRPFGAKGRFFGAGVGKATLTYYGEGQRLRCERNFELERSSVDALVVDCPSLLPDEDEAPDSEADMDSWVLGEEGVLALLSELRDAKTKHELEWPDSVAMRLRGNVSSKSLHGRLKSKKGWYLATGGVTLDDVTEIALAELVHAPSLAGGRFLRLPSGDYVEVEKRIRRVVAALQTIPSAKRGSSELAIHPGALATLEELAEPDSGFEVDAEASDWLERTRALPSKTFPVPTTLLAELRSYQVEGYRWLSRLSELGLGACLADDMGLGKTVQVLALLLNRASGGPALVVAPTSVCSNWAIEIKRFAPSLTPVEYVGKNRVAELHKLKAAGAGKVLICSYALLQQDEAELTACSWETAVLDEAQFIKNSESLRAQAAFKLSAKQRLAVTGTPVENHFGDLWSIFKFINPGLFGDWAHFNRRFVKPIERDGSAVPAAMLRQIVQPYVLRRLKRDVLAELPPLTEVQHDVHLSHDEALRYALLRKQIHEKLFTSHGKRQNKIEVLAEITRLRRFCCHPKLVFPDADNESAKIQTFLDLVEELRENQHRALVFSQYVDFLSLVRERLEERRVSYEYLDGSTPQAERQARVDAFQNGSASLFLISLKAGGFGLNLTAADYVIHLDPWWNPAVEQQATDRAHRIGQTRRVTVYRLVTKNTIEEQIIKLHDKKQRLARSLFEGGEQIGKVSAAELVKLIEGDGDGVEETV